MQTSVPDGINTFTLDVEVGVFCKYEKIFQYKRKHVLEYKTQR